MGVVNVTPDSFSDGGRFSTPSAAVAHGPQLARPAPTSLDVGGEATDPRRRRRSPRPRSCARVAAGDRARCAARGRAVSVDTTKAEVAEAALDGGRRDRQRRLGRAVRSARSCGGGARRGAAYRARPPARARRRTMRREARYDDVVREVAAELARAGRARAPRRACRGADARSTRAWASARPTEHNLAAAGAAGELGARSAARWWSARRASRSSASSPARSRRRARAGHRRGRHARRSLQRRATSCACTTCRGAAGRRAGRRRDRGERGASVQRP